MTATPRSTTQFMETPDGLESTPRRQSNIRRVAGTAFPPYAGSRASAALWQSPCTTTCPRRSRNTSAGQKSLHYRGTSSMKYWVLLGRILYSVIFVVASISHFSNETINYAAAQGVPLARLVVPAAG